MIRFTFERNKIRSFKLPPFSLPLPLLFPFSPFSFYKPTSQIIKSNKENAKRKTSNEIK